MKSQKSCHSLYEIRVEGELGDMWVNWFECLSIRQEFSQQTDRTITVLYGPISDQPALHAVLNKIRDLNLALISVKKIAPNDSESQERDQNGEETVRPRQ